MIDMSNPSSSLADMKKDFEKWLIKDEKRRLDSLLLEYLVENYNLAVKTHIGGESYVDTWSIVESLIEQWYPE